MRDYGKVYTKFWTGRARELSEDGRVLFLYLLTSPHSNGIGCYRLPVAYVAADLGWAFQHPADTVSGTVSDRVSDTLRELVEKGFIDRDEQRDWIRLVNWFEHNPIENPSVAKSFIPFIEAVPSESPVYQKLIDGLRPFKHRFSDGYIEGVAQGVGHGVAHPVDRVSDTESSSSSRESKSKNAAAALSSEDARTNGATHRGQKEINLLNFDAAAACCAATHRRVLTPTDEAILLGWHKRGYDIEKDVLPVLVARTKAFMEKKGSMPANPLAYFDKAVSEAAEKRRKSVEN